mgnify:CR=1 FL=1
MKLLFKIHEHKLSTFHAFFILSSQIEIAANTPAAAMAKEIAFLMTEFVIFIFFIFIFFILFCFIFLLIF